MNRFIKIKIVFILYLLFSSYIKAADNNSYSFKQISLQDGMPSKINCIHSEERGFIWAGTQNGVIRYDGKVLRTYNAFNKEDSLPSNRIIDITEDNNQQIWALTSEGIAKYSLNYDRFSIPLYNGKPIIAQSACKTKDELIFGSFRKIYKYSCHTNRFSELLTLPVNERYQIQSIQPLNDKELVCFDRREGIYKVNLETKQTKQVKLCDDKYILDMKIDNKQNYWLSPYNKGLKCYSKDGKLIAHYTTENSKLNCNIIMCITIADGLIWLGTDGGGINILNPQTGEISILEQISGDTHSLPVNTILCLHKDSQNNDVWAGSNRGGLINIRKVSMKTYMGVILGYNKGLSESTVLCLYEDSLLNKIWIGTDGGGINKFNPENETFQHYPNTWGDKIVSICGYSEKELLISVFSKGLFLINKDTGIKRPFLDNIENLNQRLKYSGLSVNIFQETPHSILIFNNPIYRYDIRSNQLIPIKKPASLELNTMICPIKQNEKAIYLHDLYNIYRIRKDKDEIEVIYQFEGKDEVNTITQDKNGIFWIASSTGLSTYNPRNKKYEKIETQLFHEVSSLLCDNNGHIWIGTEKNLFSYQPETKQFVLYGESDGIISNEYIAKARLLSKSGNIYLGGVKGLLFAKPNASLKQKTPQPNLHLIGFAVGGENRMAQIKNMQAQVPWNSKNIKIRVMPFGEDILRTKIYKYQIGTSSIESYSPELNLPALAVGTYPIWVSYNTKEGIWTQPQKVLTLTIIPPWYKTWWFTLLWVIICLSILAIPPLLFLKRQKSKLEKEMILHKQNVYEEKVRFLINISHELRTPLTLIYTPLGRLLKNLSENDKNYLTIKRIYKQTQRMKDLINMVLDVRKMEVGESKLLLHKHNLNQWLQDTGKDFIDEGDEKNIQISFQLDPNVTEVVYDQNKLMIIISNLLINALKYSPENGTILLKTELCQDDKFVKISISDQGNGINGLDSKKLFTRFYQGNQNREGSGIGLSYAKMLIELHHGEIGAYNNSDKGATFFIKLPVTLTPSEEPCQPKAYLNDLMDLSLMKDTAITQPTIDKDKFQQWNILIVDDNNNLTDFLSDELKGLFKSVQTAQDGKEALAVLEKEKIDIIVSDIMMPNINGFELCKLVKENTEISHIPIVLLTAQCDESAKSYGSKLGADAYLEKPFETDELIYIIYNLLYSREQIKAHYHRVGVLPQPNESTFSTGDEQFMKKLNHTIETHITNAELDIPLLCKEIGISRASLYNKLKEITGMGANEYINKYRLEEAIKLIKTTQLSFAEIADRTGFSTARYFSTLFKQYTGKTPTLYKADYLSNLNNECNKCDS